MGIDDWSAVADENTGIAGIDISEGCPAANINNAFRQMMADIRLGFDAKAPVYSPALAGMPTAPTAEPGTSTDQIATTEFVESAVEAAVNEATGIGSFLRDFVPLLVYANGEAAELAWQNRMAIARYEDWIEEEADRHKRDMDMIAHANDEAIELFWQNKKNMEHYDDWHAKGLEHIVEAKMSAMLVVQSIRDMIEAFDESVARHRLQIRLLDGTNPGASSRPVLFVVSGQSNAVGFGNYRPFDQALDCGQFWSWQDGANELRPLKDPTGHNPDRGSGWCQFARRFFALTGRRIILLNIGSGGSAVTDGGSETYNTWADNDYGTLRTSRLNIWNAFHAAVPESAYDLGAILWVQGETDASRIYSGDTTVSEYKAGTLSVLKWTREELIGDEDCPVFIGKIGFNSSAVASPAVMAAYRKVQKAEEDICNGEDIFMGFSMAPYFADAWDEYMSDNIHYSHNAYMIYGNAFARSVVNYLNF